MICNKCGSQVENGQAFCTNCGANMPVAATNNQAVNMGASPSGVDSVPNLGMPSAPSNQVNNMGINQQVAPRSAIQNVGVNQGGMQGSMSSPGLGTVNPVNQAPVMQQNVNPVNQMGVEAPQQIAEPTINNQAPVMDMGSTNPVDNGLPNTPQESVIPVAQTTQVAAVQDEKTKKKSKAPMIILLGLVLIVLVVGILIATKVISIDAFFKAEVPANINNEKKTTEPTTTKPVVQHDMISVSGVDFTIPTGYKTKDLVTTNGVYYVYNNATNLSVAFNLKNATLTDTTLIDAAVLAYQATGKYTSVVPSSLTTYESYSYYTIDLTDANGVVNTEFIVQYKDNMVFDCVAHNTAVIGNNNYLQLITNLMSSAVVRSSEGVVNPVIGAIDYDFSVVAE